MESIGERLKKARQALGISLEEVHKKTKIHLNILKAIEEDRFISLSPIYIKGFLKIYCKFLGVDFQDYISDYKQSPSLPLAKSEEKPISAPRPSIKLVMLRTKHIGIKTVFIILILILAWLSLFKLGRTITSKRRDLSRKAKFTTASKTLAEKKAAIPEFKITGNIRLGIQARDDCWIQLKVDGRIVFQSILKKGRSETWVAKDKIELSVGNAGALDLEVNGKFISKLGRKGQVLKNILITKEGITIGR